MKLGILLLGLILLSSSKCTFREPPETELCGALTDYSPMMFCTDPRTGDRYDRELMRGDICTNSSDYASLQIYCEELRKDLKKCKRKNR